MCKKELFFTQKVKTDFQMYSVCLILCCLKLWEILSAKSTFHIFGSILFCVIASANIIVGYCFS